MKFATSFNAGVFVVTGLFVVVAFAGCWKKSGEALVEEKEYIAAGEMPTTPAATVSAETAVQPGATPQESSAQETYVEMERAPDEIVVDSYVMKKNVRGTSKDPRAHPGREQWRIKVRMIQGGGAFIVQAEKKQYERLKAGDRVKVEYREGKYTGTVWNAEIID